MFWALRRSIFSKGPITLKQLFRFALKISCGVPSSAILPSFLGRYLPQSVAQARSYKDQTLTNMAFSFLKQLQFTKPLKIVTYLYP